MKITNRKPILILLASKGRHQKIEGFYKSWRETTEGYSEVLTSLDLDDLTLNQYKRHKDISFDIGIGKSLCGTYNRVFFKYPNYKYYFIVSDDHRIQTKYWESRFMEIIEENGGKGVAYGNDLFEGEKLATSTFVSGNIFRALGFLALPELYHMWIDNFFTELGRGLNKLFYFPDIFIEHMHFTLGKSKADNTYNSWYKKSVWERDRQIFIKWERGQKARDIEKIKRFND